MNEAQKKQRKQFIAVAIVCLLLACVGYVFALPGIEDPDRIDPAWTAVSGLFGLGSVIAMMKALRVNDTTERPKF